MIVSTLERAPKSRYCGDDPCTHVGELTRLRYFHGQALGAVDLRREQSYHLEKARLRNRVLHGWGIVCGLDVEVAAEQSCDPTKEDETPEQHLVITPGVAIDCPGNEIVVRHPRPVSLRRLLSPAELRHVHETPTTVYLTLCYREELIDPTRPLLLGGCDTTPPCEHARVCETYRICATTVRPDPGPDCEPCCAECGDPCLELAAFVDYDPNQPLDQASLDLSGRRTLSRHRLATITGINWVHGASYEREDVAKLLQAGLEVRLSRGVQVASLLPGVVELTGIEGGAGRAAGFYNIAGQFSGLPASGLTDRFTYVSVTEETFQYGDRLLITVRGDYILDECCVAGDFNNGGGVPALDELPVTPSEIPTSVPCAPRPSGDGTPGGDFVSWIFARGKAGQ